LTQVLPRIGPGLNIGNFARLFGNVRERYGPFTFANARAAADKTEVSTTAKPRKEKEVFSIDFSKRNTAEFEKKLFEPPAKGTLTLPAKQCAYIGGKRKRGVSDKREEKLLPDDMHFSNRQLLSLFLKPKFMVNSRTFDTNENIHRLCVQVNFRGHRAWLRRTLSNSSASCQYSQCFTADHNDEIDENFWAKAAADAAMPVDDGANQGEPRWRQSTAL